MRFSKSVPVKIVVIGAGGTGGWVIPHIYRLCYSTRRPTRVVICDGDIVEEKNLVRQNFIRQDIGRNKAEVLAERYSSAFGIECEYRPLFIEDENTLKLLTHPDIDCELEDDEPEKVILISAVDNIKSRLLFHQIFKQSNDLIYIDAGNGLDTGQVICGIRSNGRTMLKPVFSVFPEMAETTDRYPSELSCADRAVSEPQTVTANLCAAYIILAFLYNLLIQGKLRTHYTTFSSDLINIYPVVIPKRKKRGSA